MTQEPSSCQVLRFPIPDVCLFAGKWTPEEMLKSKPKNLAFMPTVTIAMLTPARCPGRGGSPLPLRSFCFCFDNSHRSCSSGCEVVSCCLNKVLQEGHSQPGSQEVGAHLLLMLPTPDTPQDVGFYLGRWRDKHWRVLRQG